MSAEIAVQGALFSALSGLGLTVYDAAPQEPSWPYVEIGATQLVAYDTFTETGFDVMARIHTRSRSAGMKEAKEIQGAIYAALHRKPLIVTGFTTILIWREVSEPPTRAPDGSFHGVCEYRGLITT